MQIVAGLVGADVGTPTQRLAVRELLTRYRRSMKVLSMVKDDLEFRDEHSKNRVAAISEARWYVDGLIKSCL